MVGQPNDALLSYGIGRRSEMGRAAFRRVFVEGGLPERPSGGFR